MSLIPRIALLPLLGLAALSACTVQRMEQDTVRTLEWLRFKHGSAYHGTARWQLPPDTSILVEELTPAPDPSWLPAAQQGINSVFPTPVPSGTQTFRLLIAWPESESTAESSRVSLWNVVDMGQLLPDFQRRFALRVALIRDSDGVVVDAAQLDVTPRWLSGRGAGPTLVRNAFRDFARTFHPTY